jgi:hypothetical protein
MNLNDLEHWNIAAMRAAASRERTEAIHALLARFAAWLRSTPTIRAPQAKGRACFKTGC